MNFLLICFAFDTLQYRVLRCAAELARGVYVLGPPSARRLAFSRFCTGFIPASSLDSPSDADRARKEVDAAVLAHDIALVVPGDGRAARLMSLLPPLRARSFPVPDHVTFDLLNDKWRFGELCEAIDVPHPRPRLFHDWDVLRHELTSGAIRLPTVIKPTNMAGGRYVQIIRSRSDAHEVRHLPYGPILAQPYVEGEDICLSAYCREGQIVASVVYRKQRGDCIFTSSAELLDLAGRILKHVGYDGVANFDARLDRRGRIHLIECNPRFWFTMDMTLLAGVNFVGLSETTTASCAIPAPRIGAVLRSNGSLLRALARPWTLTACDLTTLRYRLRDPIPPLYELFDRLRGHIPEG